MFEWGNKVQVSEHLEGISQEACSFISSTKSNLSTPGAVVETDPDICAHSPSSDITDSDAAGCGFPLLQV